MRIHSNAPLGHPPLEAAAALSIPRAPFSTAVPAVARADGPPPAIVESLRSLERGQRFVDRVIRQALAGRSFSQDELIAIQAGVYRYTQELELFSRMVEKAVSGMKQTLGTQT